MSGTAYNIVRYQGAAIELESPFKLSAGIHPDTNHCTLAYSEFSKIQLGVAGSLQFFYSNASEPDLTIASITALDAQAVEFGTVTGGTSAQTIKYRLVLIDSRYGFVEPRGGRLAVGFVNPSTIIPPDADRTHVPQSRTMTECIIACINSMGITCSPPDVDTVTPPKDLKWFGTHAPSELEKLLEASDLIFNLQCDGSFTIVARNAGSGPTIPAGSALPEVSFPGADARGTTVIFASYPTQVINTFTEGDLTPTTDLTIVARNASNGAWQKIDNAGVYGTGTAISEMNNHFPHTASPQDQSNCYRFLRLNPDKFDPLNSPILRKTFDSTGIDPADPNGLPPQIEIKVSAVIATQDPNTKLWSMAAGSVRVPVDRVLDGNVISLHHRLVKLKSGVTTTSDLEANCDPINMATDISIRLSVGSSQWDATNQLFEPEYYYLGYTGTPDSPQFIPAASCPALLNQPGTLVIPIAELVAMRYGLNTSTDPVNLTTLKSEVLALAPRFLKDNSTPARVMEGVGFLPFTFDGSISNVEIDQRKVTTRFDLFAFYRPIAKHVARQFHRARHPKESHPHEGKTGGTRTNQGHAGSSQPVQSMSQYVPPAPPATAMTPIELGTYSGYGVYNANIWTGTPTAMTPSSGSISGISAGAAVLVINGSEYGNSNAFGLLTNTTGQGLGPLPAFFWYHDSTLGKDVYLLAASAGAC